MKQNLHLKAGFSILSLVVVIFFSLVALLVIPMVTAPIPGNGSKLLTNGRGIYVSVFSQIADVNGVIHVTPNEIPLPMSKNNLEYPDLQFETSTDYFVYLVTNDVMSVNWSYFSGPEVPSAPGKHDPEGFKPENNAWHVVADLKVDEVGTPFLISRNLQEYRLKQNYADDEIPTLKGPPYGTDALVVIRMGGSGESMKDKNILWKNLNPAKADNLILQP
jgi:hypothetical protein